MIRKVCLLAIFLLSISAFHVNAQTDSINVWAITNKFLVKNGENSPNDSPYPEIIKGKGTTYSFFIFTENGEVSDPDFMLPYSEELKVYSFGILAPHTPMHLLFFKGRKWYGINMKKDLPEIMSQCVNLCEKLVLPDNDAIFVFSETLRRYEMDARNSGGVPIIN